MRMTSREIGALQGPVRPSAAAQHQQGVLVPFPCRDLGGDLLGQHGDDENPAKRKFKGYPIGYFHIDIAEVRTAQGKLYLLVVRI
jgi:hypothetical protein